ncbi:MAG: 5-(carboxyamino)imidazole ribonucleotide synthase [Phycisphaerales bacterium]
MLIGVLGGGQLGMMLAQAGKPLGHTFRFLDPSPESPASSEGEFVQGDYSDTRTLETFGRGLDLVTWEFENVPSSAVQVLSRRLPCFPGIALLEIAQDRLSEKTAFREIGLAPARHVPISSRADLQDGVGAIGLPCVLKTRRMGYDGKGQFVLRGRDDVEAAWCELGRAGQLVLEEFLEFEFETSLIACRGKGGGIVFYPMPMNTHKGGILRLSRVGAGAEIEPELEHQARAAMAKLMDGMDYVGVLTFEFFVVRRGEGRAIIANEMAPRVHNSGHWTIEGARTSQFANHCLAITKAELGSTALLEPAAAMINIVGEQPDPSAVKSIPGATLHLYGKQPRPGRKLGHMTVTGTAESVDRAIALSRGLPGVMLD